MSAPVPTYQWIREGITCRPVTLPRRTERWGIEGAGFVSAGSSQQPSLHLAEHG